MDIAQRLELFFRRLAEAPLAGTAEEALALVCRLIEEVEDEFCPLPRKNPPPFMPTGRMYAPQADNVQRFPDGMIAARARHHQIVCRIGGGISVVYVPTDTTVLEKKGKYE